MSTASTFPEDGIQATKSHSFFGRIRLGIQKSFPVVLILSTCVLFLQTWGIQNSCSPLIGSGAITCHINSINIQGWNITVDPGESKTITAKVDLSASDLNNLNDEKIRLRWQSSDNNVFTVVPNSIQQGKITDRHSVTQQITVIGKNPGEAELIVASATNAQLEDKKTIQTRGVRSLYVQPDSLRLRIGDRVPLTAVIHQFGNIDQSVIWRTTNNKIATISRRGVVKGVTEGRATISATSKFDPSYSTQVLVNVEVEKANSIPPTVSPSSSAPKPPVDHVQIQRNNLTLWEGDSTTLRVKVFGEGTSSDQVTWHTNSRQIARIDGDGREVTLNALKPGRVTITATSQQDTNKFDALALTVSPAEVTDVNPLTWQELVALNVGEPGKLCTVVNGHGNYNPAVRWTSSNSAIATIDENTGEIDALRRGSTQITATSVADSSKFATVELQVPKQVNWLAVGAGSLVAAGTMVFLVPPPAAIAMGTGTAFLVNLLQGTSFPNCS